MRKIYFKDSIINKYGVMNKYVLKNIFDVREENPHKVRARTIWIVLTALLSIPGLCAYDATVTSFHHSIGTYLIIFFFLGILATVLSSFTIPRKLHFIIEYWGIITYCVFAIWGVMLFFTCGLNSFFRENYPVYMKAIITERVDRIRINGQKDKKLELILVDESGRFCVSDPHCGQLKVGECVKVRVYYGAFGWLVADKIV